MMQQTSVVLVDDHPVIRDGLAFLLGEQPDFLVVGEAENIANAISVIEQTRPQVVVLDLSLDGEEAIPLIGRLRERWPELRILVLSMHEEDLYAERLLTLGAHGYIMKQETPTEFLRALRRVAAGDIHVSQAVGERLVARVRRGVLPGGAGPVGALTDRERDVLRLIARGMATREISAELAMNPKTVDSHRRNIREKLGLANARALVRYAARWAEEIDDGGPLQ